MRLALAAVALVVTVGPGRPADEAAVACGATALMDYSKAVVALFNSPESQSLPSIDAVVKKRRYSSMDTGAVRAEDATSDAS